MSLQQLPTHGLQECGAVMLKTRLKLPNQKTTDCLMVEDMIYCKGGRIANADDGQRPTHRVCAIFFQPDKQHYDVVAWRLDIKHVGSTESFKISEDGAF